MRGLEREIGSICRHTVMRKAEGEADLRFVADAAAVESVLGPPKYLPDLAERTSQPGVATGLAWTPSGGDILFIEATKMPGKGVVTVTGNLEERHERERRHGGVVFVRSRAKQLGLDPEFLKATDLHLHVPKGGTPKDHGPERRLSPCTASVGVAPSHCVRCETATSAHDRRHHPARKRAAGGRDQGEAPRGAPGGHPGSVLVARPQRPPPTSRTSRRACGAATSLTVHLIKRVDEVLPLVLEPPVVPPPPQPQAEVDV